MMNEIVVQYALIDYIKSLNDSKLKDDAINSFMFINEKRKAEGISHFIEPFRTMGLSRSEQRNYYEKIERNGKA